MISTLFLAGLVLIAVSPLAAKLRRRPPDGRSAATDRLLWRAASLVSGLALCSILYGSWYAKRALDAADARAGGLRPGDAFEHAELLRSAGDTLVIWLDPRCAACEASAQFYLYNMMLYAQAKGLGCCLWGGGKMLLNRSREVRERLGMQKGEHILGIVVLGYAAVEFANKVEGKTLPIRWNGQPGRGPERVI